MSEYMAVPACIVLALAAIAGGLRLIARREDRIRQQQWWRSWQREQYRHDAEDHE